VRARIFRKYCFLLLGLVVGSLVLLVLPLWILRPPYGKAFLLSLPPMLVTALSWMGGAWWAWGKGGDLLLVATLGAIPLRVAVVLLWAGLVLSVPGTPVAVFLVALMLHWILFTVAELAMVAELSRQPSE